MDIVTTAVTCLYLREADGPVSARQYVGRARVRVRPLTRSRTRQ